ncbi:MAG: hypothetical protein JNK85_28065 [Verrucomicrobiales bacterium]|nr:hypothetical protein [Verrucomicrobiales bacterium]
MATGLNYWDGTRWTPSTAAFQPVAHGFEAGHQQFKVTLHGQLNVEGSVTMRTPDGITVRSTPLGIALYDFASGKSLFIAELKDVEGLQVADHQIVYLDAFEGVSADILYTVDRASFAQDVIIRNRIDPAAFGLPPETTRLQIVTEIYGDPAPQRIRQPIRVETNLTLRRRHKDPDFVDEVLGFGEMVIATGRIAAPDATDTSGSAAPVAKQWLKDGTRTFLVESVEMSSIRGELDLLPEMDLNAALKKRTAPALSLFASAPTRRGAASGARVASPVRQDRKNLLASVQRPGVVIDYLATLGGTLTGTIRFQGDTTYFVSGPVICNGPTTIEGGAVFKYPKGPPAAYLKFNNSVTVQSSQYRPVIFTASDDDTLGESAAGLDPNYTGVVSGVYANPALWVYYQSSPVISNARFYYCQEAIRLEGGTGSTGTVSHSQLVNCIKGIVLTGSGSGSGSGLSLTAHNNLMVNVQSPLTSYANGAAATLRHCSVDQGTALATATSSSSFTFVNSVLANLTQLFSGPASVSGSYNGFYNAPQFGTSKFVSASSPFQAVDSGMHYLAGASTLRAKGTTTVGTTLLNELKTRTTQPPVSFPMLMKVGGTLGLSPQAARYVSGAPDLGFHYDALDYSVGALILEGGALTVLPGTAVGLRNDYIAGIVLWKSSSLLSEGTPQKPNVFVASQLVQEGPFEFGGLVSFIPDGFEPPPVLHFRFSNLSTLSGNFHFWGGWGEQPDDPRMSASSTMHLNLSDCSIQGGLINLGKPASSARVEQGTIHWFNNLFDRVDINLDPTWIDFGLGANVDLSLQIHNNLFRGSRFRAVPAPTSAGSWTLKDNLFDKVAFELTPTLPIAHNYNGYWRRIASELQPGQTDRLTANNSDGSTDAVNDVLLATAPAYQSGPLGKFYLASTSPLVNTGSRTPGQAGLHQHTTRTDQVKDGDEGGTPNNVNIGLHYVATTSSSSTTPKDTDGDGVADFLEDANGNATVETAETSPLLADTDANGQPDSVSAVYADQDLDGDGLTGSMEALLGGNPLTANSFLAPIPVTTGDEPDILSYNLAVNHDTVAAAGRLQLVVDGVSPVLQEMTRNTDGTTRLSWNATYASPALHFVQPVLVLNEGYRKSSVPDPTTVTAYGALAAVRPNTVVQFAQYYSEYTDGGLLFAQLPPFEAGANYTIQLRDPSGNLFRTFTGSTDSSEILEYWDGKTSSGSTYSGTSAKATFVVTLTSPSGLNSPTSGTHSQPLNKAQNPASVVPDGTFTTCYAWDSNDTQILNKLRNAIQFSVVDKLLTPTSAGGGLTPVPYASTYNVASSGGLGGTPGYLNAQAQVPLLLQNLALAATRNFYFDGHGSETELGNERAQNDPQVVAILANSVKEALGNRKTTKGGFTRGHPYRFVFLNACNTADLSGWTTAFGIIEAITSANLSDDPRGVQGFLGWQGKPRAAESVADFNELMKTYAVFFDAWMNETPLIGCVALASSRDPTGTGFPILDFPLGKKYTFIQNKIGKYSNNFSLKIHGYPRITRGGFAP